MAATLGVCAAVEILPHPVFQVDGLAHVDDLPAGFS